MDLRFHQRLDGVVMQANGHHSEDRGESSVVGQEVQSGRRDRHAESRWSNGPIDQAMPIEIEGIRSDCVLSVSRGEIVPRGRRYAFGVRVSQHPKQVQLQGSIQFHEGSSMFEVETARVRSANSTGDIWSPHHTTGSTPR